MFIPLTKYTHNCDEEVVYVNPEEVACIQPWQYHSFRPAISEIVLKCGEKVYVWQDVETTIKLLNKKAN